MSNTLVSKYRKITVGHPIAKSILMYLADCYHPENGCFPSQATIAADIEASLPSVKRYLTLLESQQIISRRYVFQKTKVVRTYYDFDGIPQIPIPQTIGIHQTPSLVSDRTHLNKEVLKRKSKRNSAAAPKKSKITSQQPNPNFRPREGYGHPPPSYRPVP
jgi:hypothetical protein